MPYDGSGNFTIINNFEEDRINGVSIDSEKMDANFDDIANGLSDCMLRSGMSVMISDLNMGNHKIQNLTAGTSATDAVNKNQLDTLSSACVKLTGSQTITGNKSFSGSTTLGATAFNQNVDMNSHKITELANGTATTDAINKGQLDAVNNAVVHINGTETINGLKTFGNNINLLASAFSYRHIYSNNTSITKGTTPSTNIGFDYVLRDSANSNIAAFNGWYNTNGDITAALYAYTPTSGSTTHADLRVCNYAAGRADVVFSTPSGVENSCLSAETNSTASTMIPTKGWVNNPATSTNVVHRTGNETIGGTKTFSESIIANINATRNVAPSTAQFGGIGVRDNANNLFASMLASMDTSKNATAFLRVFNPKNTSTSDATYMSLHYDADGSTYVTAPASDVVNSIVTTVNKSKAANGYFQLGNGLIIQWGKSTATSSSGSVTLPKAFSSTNYAVVINDVMANVPSSQGSNANVVGWGVVQSRSTTAFTAFLCNYENSYWWAYKESGRTFTWIAIGY